MEFIIHFKKDKMPIKEDNNKRISNQESKKFQNGQIANNAGLVLLWPFLGSLFFELGLVEDKRFKGIENATLAIYILNFLATGIRNVSENELLIPKIMIGWDTEKLIPSDIILSDDICNECDHLMKTFIKHWSVLKSASLNGLREGFLQRLAFIEKKDDGWHLKFERKGADILLDQLPFSISIIKFKWLQEPLIISW
jgi:hypothetical protein